MAKVRTRDPNRYDKILYSSLIRKHMDLARLGSCVGSGGISHVYQLIGVDPPQVVKIVDTRLIQPEYRDEIFKRSLYEITHAPELGRASKFIMPIYDARQLQIPDWLQKDPEKTDHLFVMRMPRLKKLDDCIGKDFDELELIRLGMHICNALQVCYERNIIHRDVKQDNIYVSYAGGNTRYILGDFGIARDMDSGRLTVVGTDMYTAPEIFSGHCSRNSDLYSLGVTLYSAAGGLKSSEPGGHPDLAPGSTVAWDDFKRRKLVSPELQDVICKALKRVDERYQSPDEMHRDLSRILDGRRGGHPARVPPGPAPAPAAVDHAAAVKEEMMQGRFTEAIRRAQEGYDRGDLHCGCLLAYCCYHEARAGHMPEDYRVHAVNTLSEVLEQVEMEMLEGKSGLSSLRAVLQCLLATIFYDRREMDRFARLIRSSAEGGCPMAQYIYGRCLCCGTGSIQTNKTLGMEFLQKAALADYADAICYLQEQRRLNPLLPLAPELKQRMDRVQPMDQGRHRQDVIRCL